MEPLRCPHCAALVVDRRSPVCTTCRTALPADWVMNPQQSAKITATDRQRHDQHRASMKWLDIIAPTSPNVP